VSDGGPVTERAYHEHRAAVEAFLQTAASIRPERWSTPLGPGRWTPAQVALHVVSGYDVLLSQLAGGPPMKMRVGPLKSRLLRWFLLPHILFHRTLPRATAPEEVAPKAGEGVDQAALSARLPAAAGSAEEALRTTSRTHFFHAYFGAVPLRKAFPFLAVHMEHHRRQLAAFAAEDR
jgi:hypothetical protein